MYVPLEDIKQHLNVDYDTDDAYLTELTASAEAAVERFIQRKLSEVEQDGELPADLRHAVRLMVGGFYANREPVAFAQASEVPYGLMFLLAGWRKIL